MAEKRPERLAVLIDADNISYKIADALFEEVAKIGEAAVRRIYGDFSSPSLSGWAKALPNHAIIPSQNFANTTGKNATDIALVIDALDLLHSGRFDGFCLVSSDSDFTRLAARIREQGMHVYGFGEQKTPESLRNACHRFVYIENLGTEAVSAEPTATSAPHKPLHPPSKARPLIMKAIGQLDPEGDWVALGGVGSHLLKLAPDFDPRTYGFAKLSSLVEKAGGFEVKSKDTGGVWVRIKPRA
ncbi:MAG: NYN domain-containing protein [Novosphingobium sp.]